MQAFTGILQYARALTEKDPKTQDLYPWVQKEAKTCKHNTKYSSVIYEAIKTYIKYKNDIKKN